MMTSSISVGEHLRQWRQQRRLSQLDLACEADISTRHLSFIETGRAQPSRDMLLRLTDQLDVPLRQRNTLFLAAGYAPHFAEHSLADTAMDETREAIQAILQAHEPYPALAVDGHWNLVYANQALAPLMAGAATYLLEPPINVLRLSLHPDGIASRIANLGQWRAHLLQRLRRQYEQTSDPFLAELLTELSGYRVADESTGNTENTQGGGSIAVPLKLKTSAGTLSFISTTMVFGTPLDVTLSELAIETFLPADAATAAALRATV